MNPWHVTTDPLSLRRLGKSGEELSELQKVLSRVVIQGIDGIDPSTGEDNRRSMTKEIGDVEAQLELLKQHYNLDRNAIFERINEKTKQMHEWEEALKKDAAPRIRKFTRFSTNWEPMTDSRVYYGWEEGAIGSVQLTSAEVEHYRKHFDIYSV